MANRLTATRQDDVREVATGYECGIVLEDLRV